MKRLQRTNPVPKTGIVHLGPGAFFRAFNAVFTDEAMAISGGDWGICAVSLQSRITHDALAPQDWVYCAVSMSADGEHVRKIEAITSVMIAAEDPGANSPIPARKPK